MSTPSLVFIVTLNVDLGQHAVAFCFQRLGNQDDRLGKALRLQNAVKAVGQIFLCQRGCFEMAHGNAALCVQRRGAGQELIPSKL